jgi:hypothetical protein
VIRVVQKQITGIECRLGSWVVSDKSRSWAVAICVRLAVTCRTPVVRSVRLK